MKTILFESNNLLSIVVISSLVSFILGALIARAIFSVPIFLRYQKAQTVLLMYTAKNKEISDEQLKYLKIYLSPEKFESLFVEMTPISDLTKDI